MTFVTAWLAAAGAAAMAIPILIHLLSRQRRKPIEWAAMRFLLEAIRKHKRRLQLQQILLLATRCLIVLLLGAALARPILSQAGLLARGGNRAVYLVIDNSMASGLAPDRAHEFLAVARTPTGLGRDQAHPGHAVVVELAPADLQGMDSPRHRMTRQLPR
ncbi:MAG TPA: BatA domain-containing protein, partial [Phycisphaerales bacterium]|nr:BatA domain-containing protein [Phycisphaerales bacterium]